MKTLEIALRLYDHYGQVEEINHYYGLLAQYGLVQAAHEKGDSQLFDVCRAMLLRYPDQVHHPHYNFDCYRLGGNASAWAAMKGLQNRRPGELDAFAARTMAGPKSADGLLCMPGMETEGAIWIDVATAVTPFMLFAGLVCENNTYIDFAAKQCFGMYEALLDPGCGLLHQCRGFLTDPKQCSADHWSRGNGWGYLALSELVQYLPADSVHRDKAERYYQALSAAFLPYQSERGFWRQEITAAEAWEESSGTALILYGIGIGLRMGLLNRDTYIPVFTRGLSGLLRYGVNDDYSTELSCPGCLCPGEIAAKGSIQAYITEKQPAHDEHHSFGVFMLALVEAHRNGLTDIDWASRCFVGTI